MNDKKPVVTELGDLPEPVYRESEIEHVFRSAVGVDRANGLLVNLLVALICRYTKEDERAVAIPPEELAAVDGLKLVSSQDEATKVVTLRVERAGADEKRPAL